MLKSLFNRLRLKWFLASRTMDYTQTYLDQLYKIYLGHNKIIHYREGHPVYSLTTPAVFSKPAANFLARSLYRSIQNKNLPNLMSFAVNDACDAACPHCSFYAAVEDKSRPVLTLQQAQDVIRAGQELGVSVINFVGGEPLLRADLPALIRSVDKDLSTTVMFTNGSRLAERIAELKQAGLDSVYISLDAPTPAEHDRLRGHPGLFDKAIHGIQTAKKLGLSTGISYSISPEAFAAGDLDRIITLGKNIGIHEVLIFDILPTGRAKDRHDLVDNPGWIETMLASLKPYNSDPAYPGVIAFAYMTSHRSVGCSCGTSYLYLSPYGDVMSCDFNHARFGNVLEQPLYEIWDQLTSLPDFERAKWGGCKIKDSSFRSRPTVTGGVYETH